MRHRNEIYSDRFSVYRRKRVISGNFQALGKGVASLILSALRLIVIALPLAFLFTLADDAATLVWAAFPIAEAAAFVYGFIEMRFLRRKLDIEFNSDCNLSS